MTYEQIVATRIGLITITQAQLSDLDQVLDILEEAARWLTACGIDQWRPGWFKDGPFQASISERIEQGLVYLAQQDKNVLGTITLQWNDAIDTKLWRDIGQLDDAGYIHRFAIRRAWAGLGLGQCLLQWAEKAIVEAGKNSVRLDCMPENNALCTYYEQAGFICRGEVQGKGWRAKLYEKQLKGGYIDPDCIHH